MFDVYAVESVVDPATDVATLQGFETLFSNVVGIVIGIAGIVLFFMLVLGGFRWATAGGEPKKAEMARKTLTSAVIGLVLVALAFLIIRTVENFTGATISEFVIFQP